jgi:hypothetical protein
MAAQPPVTVVAAIAIGALLVFRPSRLEGDGA